ncbi:MAG: hypothetical protein C4291_15680 [Candidatus Dadabacteria bacterium]
MSGAGSWLGAPKAFGATRLLGCSDRTNHFRRSVKDKDDKKPLVSAILFLAAASVGLLRGHASWYGAGRVTGVQLIAFCSTCLVFSATMATRTLMRDLAQVA